MPPLSYCHLQWLVLLGYTSDGPGTRTLFPVGVLLLRGTGVPMLKAERQGRGGSFSCVQ